MFTTHKPAPGKKGDFYSVLFIIFATIILMTGFTALMLHAKKIPEQANIVGIKLLEAEKQLDFVVLYIDSVVRRQFAASEIPKIAVPKTCDFDALNGVVTIRTDACTANLRDAYVQMLVDSIQEKMVAISVGNQQSVLSNYDLKKTRYSMWVYESPQGSGSYSGLVALRTPLTIFAQGKDRSSSSYDGSDWSVVSPDSYLDFSTFNDPKSRYSFFISRPYSRVVTMSKELSEVFTVLDSSEDIDSILMPLVVEYLNSEELTQTDFLEYVSQSLDELELPPHTATVVDTPQGKELLVVFLEKIGFGYDLTI